MSYKGFFSTFSSGGHFVSAEQNDFCNFGKLPPKEYFCKIIMKSGNRPRRRWHLKFFFLCFDLAAISFSGAERF